ncbi:MAG: hypothetical protein CO124_00425 [Candidatus Huberarchaeum crystalense]|uniref:Uncharacterized protein n=1 Tax=Huberarchaeum crystalense TaxID=2014257 RepID=A0A2H9QSR1_HUBC1|nr:MAG: hypothetical protein CO124_00425 [Candidatus Huberarchaeum crystalense]
MTQNICTQLISAGDKKIVLEQPSALQRIFFSVRVLASTTAWYDVRMSFDEPKFCSYYSLNGPRKYFEAEGVDIFQGNIWIFNSTDTDLFLTMMEILH